MKDFEPRQIQKLFTRKEYNKISYGYTVAIEGPTCAGKTTLINTLNDQGSVVKEYNDFLIREKIEPPFEWPPKNKTEATENFLFYLGIEEKRFLSAINMEEEDMLLDRSIFTLIGFEFGARALTGIDIVSEALQILLEQEDRLLVPDKVFFLDADMATIIKRADKNYLNNAGFLFDSRFNEGFKNFFELLNQISQGYVIFIDASPSASVVRGDMLRRLNQRD